MLNPFLQLKMQFKQHEIVISYRFDSRKKGQNVEQLDNIIFQLMIVSLAYGDMRVNAYELT
jgi:hypothetical protein